MKYVLVATRTYYRYLSPNTKNYLEGLCKNKSDKVQDWIRTQLFNYIRSNSFTEDYTVSSGLLAKLKDINPKYKPHIFTEPIGTDIKDRDKLPAEFKKHRLPIKRILLVHEWGSLFSRLTTFLNDTIPNKKINYTVPEALEKFEIYKAHLHKQDQVGKLKHILNCGKYDWYVLEDKDSRKYESLFMGNCAGLDKHDAEIERGDAVFLSLRNKNNPHITIKYNPKAKRIIEIVQKGDDPEITSKYWQCICDLANKLHLVESNRGLFPFSEFEYNNGRWSI